MKKRTVIVRLVAACAGAMVATTAGAIPLDAGVWEKAAEANAILESVRRNGEFSLEEDERLRKLLRMGNRYMTAIVAYVVGESQGNDIELCAGLDASRWDWSIPDAYITVALAKKELRWKTDEEKVEAFQAMLDDPDEFVRMGAAKEIARIDVEKGKEALKQVATTGVDNFAQGEAARTLYTIGGPDLGSVRRSYMGCFEIFGMFAIVEGAPLDEYDRFWKRVPSRLLELLEQVRETGELPQDDIAYVTECAGPGELRACQHVVSAVIYSKLKDPCPDLLAALAASLEGGRGYGLPHGLINVALVKDTMRGKPETELVEALEPLTRDSNPYLRIEAAKEIARLRPDEGKELLRQLYASDNTGIVQGEAARLLEKMGDEMPYGAAHRHFRDPNYFYVSVLKLIEDEPLW